MALTILNAQQFVDDIYAFQKTKEEKSGVLYLTKSYPMYYFSDTSLITDVISVIMTYVNDEIDVKYLIVVNAAISNTNMSIYYSINGSIWLEEYYFDYADYISELANDVFFSVFNNILTSNTPFSMNALDLKHKIYSSNSTKMLHMNEYIGNSEITTKLCGGWMIYNTRQNECELNLGDKYTFVIKNVRMFKNIVEIILAIRKTDSCFLQNYRYSS